MMKRLLSALLTLALVVSLIPAVFAEDTTPAEQKYEFTSPGKNTSFFDDVATSGFVSYRVINEKDYYINNTYKENNGRNWRLFDASDANISASVAVFSFGMHKTYNTITVNCRNIDSADFALALKTEQVGFYIPEISLSSSDNTTGLKLTWFISKAEEGKVLTDYKGVDKRVLSVQNVLDTDNNTPDSFTAYKVIYTQTNEELVTAVATDSKLNFRFWGINLKPVVKPQIAITVDDVELNTTDNTTATITSTTVTGDNLTEGMSVAGGFIEYKSSNTAIATVDAETGVITAVALGTANITAQSPDGAITSAPVTVTVTAPAEPEEDEALTGAFIQETAKVDITGSYVAPSVAGIEIDGNVITPVSNGDGSYNLTAPEKKGENKFL